MEKIPCEGYVAFDCRTINIFPKSKQDGHFCEHCGGILNPIGNAVVINYE